ncbi:glycosyltransferase family 2 protein [Thomasclavelia cocleata]|uniref:glycosyltransferase family 2 protein n=1 Tax=Thomasclavelia cocleata TaxID=69824 RepID=UPI00242E582E|nr:glycosyltransferase [Thomasclavelia cocleata]
MENEIMVSICCLAYNHEKYIRKTLEGFVNQKTNFNYEILIHDDCSTDNTVNIVEEYRKKYPKLIKPIYQKENQHSKGIKISNVYQFPRAQGKYIAMCEGDDYWTDMNKLQKQYDKMEENTNCSICTHIVGHISESGERLYTTQPNKTVGEVLNNIISIESFFNILKKTCLPFQTSSYFIRKKYISDYLKGKSFFHEMKGVGDVPLIFYIMTRGNMYYIDEEMSLYRKNSIGSWSNNFSSNSACRLQYYHDEINFLEKYDLYTNSRFHQIIEHMIECMIFDSYICRKEYKKIFQKKYRSVLLDGRITRKGILYYFLYAYFPMIIKFYERIKRSNDEK